MEFNEKLQELRKRRSLTQEALAEALFVSRTAISKWESGRGYPSIDSLKALSKFFSVSIDELICSDEMLSVAENERKAFVGKYLSLICSALDILPAMLLFIPAFGNGSHSPVAVSLFNITGLNPWVKAVFAIMLALSILNGICGIILAGFDQPTWHLRSRTAGMVLSIACVAVFLATRQPYAGIVCFALLVIKGFLIVQVK